MRDTREVLDRAPTVVEFVIAEGGSVEAKQVGDFVDGYAVEERRDGRSLNEITGVEIEAGGAVQFLLTDGSDQAGETAVALGVARQMGVEVVGMEDGEGLDRILSQERREGKEERKQNTARHLWILTNQY